MLDFGIATSEADRRAIYRLRYEVYVEEMHRRCEADHDRRMLEDAFDTTAFLVYAKSGLEVVGTVRTNFKRCGPVELEDEYQLCQFTPYYPDCVACSGKLIVAKRYRNSRLGLDLASFLFDFGKQQQILFDFININVTFQGPLRSKKLYHMYQKLGYREYREPFQHSERGEVLPMVLVMGDLEHLEAICSPFGPIAAKYPLQDYSREWFKTVFSRRCVVP